MKKRESEREAWQSNQLFPETVASYLLNLLVLEYCFALSASEQALNAGAREGWGGNYGIHGSGKAGLRFLALFHY